MTLRPGQHRQLDTFSPIRALSEGGMIFHMLRWVIGDAAFDKTVKDFVAKYAQTRPVADFRAVARKLWKQADRVLRAMG